MRFIHGQSAPVKAAADRSVALSDEKINRAIAALPALGFTNEHGRASGW
jgi:hypothetical protein